MINLKFLWNSLLFFATLEIFLYCYLWIFWIWSSFFFMKYTKYFLLFDFEILGTYLYIIFMAYEKCSTSICLCVNSKSSNYSRCADHFAWKHLNFGSNSSFLFRIYRIDKRQIKLQLKIFNFHFIIIKLRLHT